MSTGPQDPELRALRRALLSVTVHHGVDFLPADDGILLRGSRDVPVSWAHCQEALRGLSATHPVAPDLLARFLTEVQALDRLPTTLIGDSVRVVGLPVTHVLNPGLSWVVERVHGDSLDLGIGVLGLDFEAPEKVTLIAPVTWRVLDLDPLRWWRSAVEHLEELGHVAAQRLSREPDALRPVGDADAVTLLGAHSFRSALAARDGGMAALAVPIRRRGWTRLSLLDPAFAAAAAVATDPVDRGFDRGVLVTADEVVLAGSGDWTLRAILDGRLPAADVAPAQRA